MADQVNHPDHYTMGGIETIDFIHAKRLGPERAHIIRYVSRAPFKGRPIQDLHKAVWYLLDLIDRLADSEKRRDVIDPDMVEAMERRYAEKAATGKPPWTEIGSGNGVWPAGPPRPYTCIRCGYKWECTGPALRTDEHRCVRCTSDPLVEAAQEDLNRAAKRMAARPGAIGPEYTVYRDGARWGAYCSSATHPVQGHGDTPEEALRSLRRVLGAPAEPGDPENITASVPAERWHCRTQGCIAAAFTNADPDDDVCMHCGRRGVQAQQRVEQLDAFSQSVAQTPIGPRKHTCAKCDHTWECTGLMLVTEYRCPACHKAAMAADATVTIAIDEERARAAAERLAEAYVAPPQEGYRIQLDGDMWCATGPGFINLQESPAGFGKTPELAVTALVRAESAGGDAAVAHYVCDRCGADWIGPDGAKDAALCPTCPRDGDSVARRVEEATP